MLRQTQTQKLSQKLIPKIVLNQNILAIPTLALDNVVKRELELNPMLEEESEFEQEESEQTPSLDDEKVDLLKDSEKADEESKNEDFDDISYDSEQDSLEKKINDEYDWDEYFQNESEDYKSYDRDTNFTYDRNNISEDNKSLTERLLLQLHLSEIDEKLRFIGEEIIGYLNDEGYFTDDPQDILQDLIVKKRDTKFENTEFVVEDVNSALAFVQYNLDPPGIAARNLKECLLIQVDKSDKKPRLKDLAKAVIINHFDALKLKKYEIIAKELNVDLVTVKEIFQFIHKLDPKPGLSEESSPGNYIVPDLIVKKLDNNFEVFLNEKFTPNIRINRAYKNLYTNDKKSLDKSTKEYIVNNFNRAKWFIDAINSRRETMLKVMRAIIERQKEFFENDGEGLKPVFEKDVAEDIKMDTSTVSRTVRGKYVQTDFGIYELRSFFTTPLSTNNGVDVSNKEVKIKLKELIDNEDKNKPLTDDELASRMRQLGFRIARRTVAKYREAINIPVAKLRREI